MGPRYSAIRYDALETWQLFKLEARVAKKRHIHIHNKENEVLVKSLFESCPGYAAGLTPTKSSGGTLKMGLCEWGP